MTTTQHYFGKQKTPRYEYYIIELDGSDSGWRYPTWYEAMDECAHEELVAACYHAGWDIEDYYDFVYEHGGEIVSAMGYRIIDVLI